MYPKNTKKPTAKSMHDLQQAVLSATPTLTLCSAFGTSNNSSLSILMTLYFLRHNSQRPQTSTNHLLIPTIVRLHLHLQNHGRYLMKLSFNLHLHYKLSKPTKTFNLTMIHPPLLTSCNDMTLNSGGTFSATRSKLSLYEKPGHSYAFHMNVMPCQ